MSEKLVRSPGLFLAGFMGCGKTTVGLMLAGEMGWEFVDLDQVIEEQMGIAIAAVFEHKGEDEFRRIEREAVKAQARAAETGHARIVALGGGAFAQAENRDLLRDAGVVVWLDAPLEIIRRRIVRESHRPLARDPDRFAGLYEERRASYALADYRVDASGEAALVVKLIMELPLW